MQDAAMKAPTADLLDRRDGEIAEDRIELLRHGGHDTDRSHRPPLYSGSRRSDRARIGSSSVIARAASRATILGRGMWRQVQIAGLAAALSLIAVAIVAQ